MINPTIRCIGGAALDHKLKANVAFIAASSNPVACFTSFGGVARNVAENLSRWQLPVHLQTVVGDDTPGEKILSALKLIHIDTTGSLTMAGKRTAQYYAALNPDGELHLAFADMNIFDHVPIDEFTKAWHLWHPSDLVFLDTNLPAAILAQAISVANRQSIKLMIDPVSCAKSEKLPENMVGVFLIKPNLLELSALTRMAVTTQQECLSASLKLLARGVTHVVTTLGQDGFLWVSNEQHAFVKAPVCSTILDVNGCGDAFVAGLLYGLKRDATILEACILGQQTAVETLKTQHSVAAAR